jgi:16S rRNA (uracil1498-N3)-methyltransferase
MTAHTALHAPATPALHSPRFYVPQPLSPGQVLKLPASVARHIQVLRLRPGAAITLFNGAGGEVAAQLQTSAGGAATQAQVLTHTPVERELAFPFLLAQAVVSHDKMDWLLEKMTELGAAGFFPVLTARSVIKLQPERAEKRLAHWQGVVAAACEQCGRNTLPQLHAAQALAPWLASASASAQRLLATPNATQSLTGWARQVGMPTTQPVILLVGPEGGWEAHEETLALQAGFQPVHLGSRVLRTETAGLAALSLLQGAWGAS